MICYVSVLRVNKVMLPVKHIFSSNSFFVAVECPEVNKTAKGLCISGHPSHLEISLHSKQWCFFLFLSRCIFKVYVLSQEYKITKSL